MGKWTVRHLMPDDTLRLGDAYQCDSTVTVVKKTLIF